MKKIKQGIKADIFIFFLTIFLFLPFFNRGITVHDEGYILYSSDLISRGLVIYKDFFIQYTPGLPLLLGFLFKLFGSHILIGRFLTVLLGGLINVFLYKISKQITAKNLQFLPSILFIFWGIPHINFPWPGWFTLLFLLLALYFFLISFQNPSNNSAFLCGFSSSLIFLFKQNAGLIGFLIIVILFSRLVKKRRFNDLLILSFGYLVPFLLMLLYMVFTDSLIEASSTIFQFNFHYWQNKIMFLAYPRFEIALSVFTLSKTFLYYFPIFTIVLAVILSFLQTLTGSDKKPFLFINLLCFLYFLVGMYPTADILHLVVVLPVSFISFLYLLEKSYGFKKNLPFVAFLLAGFFLAILGLHKIFFRNYYAYNLPYSKQIHKLNIRGDTLYADKSHQQSLEQMKDFFKKNTEDGEKIFVYFYAPMIYYVSERDNITRFPIVLKDYLLPNWKEELLRKIESRTFKYAVLQITQEQLLKQTNKESNDPLMEYLIKNFEFIKQIENLQIRRQL